MNWNTEAPKQTGKYIVSIQRQKQHGQHAFNYAAHYDADTRKWYRYDPFDDNYTPKEEITDKVNAWVEDLGVFLT